MTLVTEPKRSPGVEEKESGTGSLTKVKHAIQAAYPHIDGHMVVKPVSSRSGVSWYRVNWYRDSERGMFIHHSLFLAARQGPDGIVVEDLTVKARAQASVN
jgi:hypothetical protein